MRRRRKQQGGVVMVEYSLLLLLVAPIVCGIVDGGKNLLRNYALAHSYAISASP